MSDSAKMGFLDQILLFQASQNQSDY